MARPICFVLMPFDLKRDPHSGELVDFEQVYARLIGPAVADAGLRAYRADEELQGGIFHKRMFERLTMCEYAIADLSHANANVFYELGIRHACRPWSTVLLYQRDSPLPLDVALDSALAYSASVLDQPTEVRRLREHLTRRLQAAQERAIDSPVFQLVAGMPVPEVDHRRVDAMLATIDRETEAVKEVLRAKTQGLDALRRVQAGLGDLSNLDAEVAFVLLMAFRAHEGWTDMVTLVRGMSPLLTEALLVREQYALALCRAGLSEEAEGILKAILKRRRSSETFGLLGGVYKRQWLAARDEGKNMRAVGLLKLAEETYRAGFECDWRDPYPGVNAVTLRAVRNARDAEFQELLHVVRYSVRRRLTAKDTEYWDHAGALQLAIIAGDDDEVLTALQAALTKTREPFETRTTWNDLRLLEPLCAERGATALLDEVMDELSKAHPEADAPGPGESSSAAGMDLDHNSQ